MKLTKFAALMLLGALIVGCCPCKKGKSVALKPLKETVWQLTQLDGRSFKADKNYFIVLGEDGRLSGRGDCNRLMGGYTEEAGRLVFGQMGATRMMCQDQAQEDAFVKMLGRVNAYKIDGTMLMLLADGELVAIFDATQMPAEE